MRFVLYVVLCLYMNREIKFRAWMDDGNDIMAGYERWGEVEDFWMMVRKHEFPVMQFTGLKDKNGTEIYEGDIVEFKAFSRSKTVAEVSYDVESALWEPMVCDWDAFWTALGPDCEIVGNIFETPELLES